MSAAKKNVKKGKQQLVSLKSDVGLCSRLYIGCSTTDGNPEEFKIKLLHQLSLIMAVFI